MLVLSKAQIYQALDWVEAIDAIAEGYAALACGQADIPLRMVFDLPAQAGLLLLMPGAINSDKVSGLGVKLVSVFNNNPARQLPLIFGLVALFEADTGRPLALFDGATITAIRTGAVSGLATRLLARPDAANLALFGAGVQAETQLLAIAAVRNLQSVKIYSRTPAKTVLLVQKISAKFSIPIMAVDSPAAALVGADIVATATTSPTPVFEDANLPMGVHINGVGSYTHQMQEIPAETVARARLVVDTLAGCMAEAGDVLIPLKAGLFAQSHIYAELGELCTGQKAGRATNEEISFFKSVGNAVQDVALATYLYHKATQLGLGVEVEL